MHALIVQQPYPEENCEYSKYSSDEKVMSCRYFKRGNPYDLMIKNNTQIFNSFSWNDIVTIDVGVVYMYFVVEWKS